MKSVEYKCNTCGIVTTDEVKCSNKEIDVPKNWITLDFNFYNNNQESTTSRRLVSSKPNSVYHFCSKKCFLDEFFYSDEKMKEFENERIKREKSKKLKPTNLTL